LGALEKSKEKKNMGFKGTTRKKKTTLETLEKPMKKKTTTSKFWP
jgi:hypothetical protein